MKVFNVHASYNRMTTEEQRKVSILKLAPVKKHIQGVGVRDDKYFVLVETAVDDEYLAFSLSRKRNVVSIAKAVEVIKRYL
tara:strand:+ start:325 stop:567 length:243 start_codon:yes stop_codon:yes gene_type:complete